MHPIEQAWQAFRKNVYYCVNALDTLLQAGLASRSPMITCQSSRLGTVIVRDMKQLGVLDRAPDAAMHMVNSMASLGNAWAGYRENKRIYQLTPELIKELGKFKDPLGWPLRALRLPHRGIALDFSSLLGSDHPDAYFLLSYDDNYVEEGDHPTLVIDITRVNTSRHHPEWVCSLPAIPTHPQQTLWEAIIEAHQGEIATLEQVIEEVRQKPHGGLLPALHLQKTWRQEIEAHRREMADGPEGLVNRCSMLPAIVSALYYLQGDPAVVKSIHPGMEPPRRPKKINWPKTLHKQTLVAPTVQLIGEQFSAAIKHYEVERLRLKQEHQGGTKCPHLRRPHLHAYWKGPNRDDLSIKFLNWIGVAGAEVPAGLLEAYTPIITPVD